MGLAALDPLGLGTEWAQADSLEPFRHAERRRAKRLAAFLLPEQRESGRLAQIRLTERRAAKLPGAIPYAEKHQVGVIYPDMLGAKGSDFNDLAAAHGLAAVKNQVEAGVAKTMGVSRHDVEDLVKAHMGDKALAVEPKDNGQYSGTTLGNIGYHSAQQTGKWQAVIHKVSDLNQVPKSNKDVSVNYRNGKATVRAPAKDIDLGR